MKKQTGTVLLVITLLFMTFTVGLFLGKNYNHNSVHLSELSTSAQHNIQPQYIPTDDQSAITVTFPVNINTADIAELSALPGIGEVLAQRIMDYRNKNGFFSAPEELLNVSGIGAGKLEAILDYVSTGG